MQYRKLGHTEVEVSLICLGTMTFGEQNSLEEGHAQLDYALERGINFIDTAEMYAVPGRAETQGSTERIIGEWLHKRGGRDKIILATKVTGPSAGLRHIRNPLNFSSQQIRQAMEGSLHRLQTDYVDLYQLHWPERKTNFFGKRGFPAQEEDAWEDNFLDVLQTLDSLRREGKLRYIGLSNETPWGVHRMLQLAELHSLPRIVSIQNPYSLLNRTFEVGLAEMALREKVGLLAYSPLAFGLLSGKYHHGTDKPGDRINRFKQLSRYNGENARNATARYLALAEEHGLSPTHLALAFINSRPFLTSNIIGATTMEQLKENIDSAEVELSPDILREIERIQEEIPNPAP